MLKIFRFLQGYLDIMVFGFSPERFMNLCSTHHIFLWDIKPGSTCYEMKISLNNFYKLQPIMKKTKTRVKIINKTGFPFILQKWKTRKLFLFGFVFCFFVLVYLSTFVWAIEIDGNTQLSKEMAFEFLKEQGIYYGTKKKEISIETIEKSIRNEFHFITWASIKLDGTRLKVFIKENDLLDGEKEKKREAGDLTASKDGTVEYIVTRSGIPIVKLFDEVKEGDILVSGAIPIMGDDQTLVKEEYCLSDADIYIQYKETYMETLPIVYNEKKYIGEAKTYYGVNLFDKQIKPFKEPKDMQYNCIMTSKQLRLFGDFYLPVFWDEYRYLQYEIVKKQYSQNEAKTILERKIEKYCEELEEKGVQIIEKSVKMSRNQEQYVASVSFILLEKETQITDVKSNIPVNEEK